MTKVEMKPVTHYECSLCERVFEDEDEAREHGEIPVVEALPVGFVYYYGGENIPRLIIGEGKISDRGEFESPHGYLSHEVMFSGSAFEDLGAHPNSDSLKNGLIEGRAKIYSEGEFQQVLRKISPYINAEVGSEEHGRSINFKGKIIRTNDLIEGWLREVAAV